MSNTRVLITADCHIHPHNKDPKRLDHCLDALTWIFEVAKKESVKHLLILGDLFHSRQRMDTLSYQRTYDLLESQMEANPTLQVVVLVGNHDMYFAERWDVASVRSLRHLPNLTVVNEPTTLVIEGHNIAFLPYTKDPLHDLESLNPSAHTMLCAHVAIDGAVLHSGAGTLASVGVESEEGVIKVAPERFNAWKQIFMGHYHAPQVLGKNKTMEYVGSPLQLSFGEAGEQKHIILYDLESGDKEYIDNTHSPRFQILQHDEIEGKDLSGDYVRIEAERLTHAEKIKLREDAAALGVPADLKITQRPRTSTAQASVKAAKNVLREPADTIVWFVDTSDLAKDDMDAERLKKVGMAIVHAADTE